MRYYELTYLISPDLPESEISKTKEKVASFIEKEGGKIEKFNKPIKIKLRYPIKKKEEGVLSSIYFYYIPKELVELEKKLKKEENILRYLILSKTPIKKIEIPKIEKKVEVKKEKKVKLEEIDKKLEEILGKI